MSSIQDIDGHKYYGHQILGDVIQVPQEQVVMSFVATCIEATARMTGQSYRTIFDRMDPSQYDDPVKSPVVQEIIMSNRIGAIAVALAERLQIEPVDALKRFFASKTCSDLHDKSTGLYLYGDLYIVDEYLEEIKDSAQMLSKT